VRRWLGTQLAKDVNYWTIYFVFLYQIRLVRLNSDLYYYICVLMAWFTIIEAILIDFISWKSNYRVLKPSEIPLMSWFMPYLEWFSTLLVLFWDTSTVSAKRNAPLNHQLYYYLGPFLVSVTVKFILTRSRPIFICDTYCRDSYFIFQSAAVETGHCLSYFWCRQL